MAKVSDKLAVIKNLMTTADTLIVSGSLVFTFLAALGHEVGKSLLEQDQIETVRGYLDDALTSGKQIVLPTDIIVAPEFKADSPPRSFEPRPCRKIKLGLEHRSEIGERPSPRSSGRPRPCSGTGPWASPSGIASRAARRLL